MADKKCNICLEVKSLDCFYANPLTRDKKESRCKNCAKLKVLARRKVNTDRTKETITTRERQRRRKEEAVEYKGGICLDCGGTFLPAVYDFHHLDPSKKDFNIGNKLGRGSSIEKIKEELDKCILLCANCHRIRHALS